MKILKRILMVIVSIIALVLIVALFIPREYAVEKEVVINKPKAEVFEYLKYLKNQHNFSTWENMDPKMENEYKGVDGTVGSYHGWKSDNGNVGQGSQEIVKITEGERIDIELKFIVPFESKAPVYFTTEAVDDSKTKVKWGMSGEMNYPMNFMKLFMSMEDMIGKEYEKSLQQLKVILEK